jgi:hypothetical protein
VECWENIISLSVNLSNFAKVLDKFLYQKMEKQTLILDDGKLLLLEK